jgi:phage terminase large subunit
MNSSVARVEQHFHEFSNFTDKQKEATRAMYKHRYVLYGGARGGGKSRWLRWALLLFLIKMYKLEGRRNLRVMLASETYKDLQDRQINKIETEFPPEWGTVKETKGSGLGFYLKEELGSGVIAFRNLDDPAKYQSAEFAAIGVDELTKNSKGKFDTLRGSLRWPDMIHTPFIAATNPGSIGHAWVKDLWIDKNFEAYPELIDMSDEFHFIQCLPEDNPHLTEAYMKVLNSLPPELSKAWVEGDWDIFQGMAFPNFSRARHILPKPINLPPEFPRWRAVDWGYTNPFCCLWFSKDPDTERIFIYRELYASGLTDLQQANKINANSPAEENISITYADPSMWSTKTMADTVSTTADEFRKKGIHLTKADNDRLSGKRKVDRLLQKLPDEFPGLLIFPQCKNLIRTLPSLALSEIQVEDVDTHQEDHAYDALRYGLTKQERHVKIRRQNNTFSPMDPYDDIF